MDMSVDVDFRVLELLCGRLCHELISPVGAINNGVELLDEEDPEFVKEAMSLIGQSARKAGQRLQFYRFAYGTAGGGSVRIDGSELAAALLDGGKVRCVWAPETARLTPPWQRLACNLLVLAAEALPRGGTVSVRPLEGGVEIVAEGDTVNVSDELRIALETALPADALTARTVHAYYTARLAEHMGARVALAREQPDRVVLAAVPVG
jgi:histidine phosphotransferase ChpT